MTEELPMWHVFASDMNTPPQDNAPLRRVGGPWSLHDALTAIDADKDANPDTVRYVLLYLERKGV